MKLSKFLATSVVATSCVLFSASSMAAHPCVSEWTKASNAFKKFESPASKIICVGIGALTTPAGSAACIAAYESGKATAKKYAAAYKKNTSDSGKIGPRGCAPNTSYTGTVLSERTFHCTPSDQRHVTVDFDITGGKGNKPLTVDVCFIDSKGKLKHHKAYTFNGAKKNTGKGFKTTFKGKAGLIPMVYLHKQTGINGYKYKLKTTYSGGEPLVVKDSRKRAKS